MLVRRKLRALSVACALGIVWFAGLVTALPALAFDPGSDLFQARTIVTGTDMRSRPDGFRRTFREVLVKASGDPSLANDPRADEAAKAADRLVQDFFYIDRMAQLPRRDEQGSRDRPYDLTVRFDPDGIAAQLAALGRRVWAGDRPPLLFRVRLRGKDGATYRLTADGLESELAREALADSAARFSMRVVLAPEGSATAVASEADGAAGSTRVPGVVPVSGELSWSDSAYGWVGQWALATGGRQYGWGISGASLDEAFRNAVLGAMRILSGHGQPK